MNADVVLGLFGFEISSIEQTSGAPESVLPPCSLRSCFADRFVREMRCGGPASNKFTRRRT